LVSELKAGKCSRYDALTSLPDKKDDNSADSKTTQLLAAAGFGETHCIEIWDYMKGSLLKTIKNAHSEWIKSIKIIPAKRMDKDRKSFFITGWYIVSGSTDNTLKFWDWKAQDPHVKSLDKLYPVSKLGQLVSWVIETRDGPQPIIITVMDEGNSAVFIAEEYIQM
jgi:WD40 repeat protein